MGLVQAIVDSFASMKGDLDSEKRSMERAWAKREKQLERVLLSTSGLYGDLQGLIGARLAPIPQLELSPEDKPALSESPEKA
ncbi:MAG: hypothetical protein HY927_08390 [Elusimicrobia bacterium]|nr:hypothetical protein [Elusimicrobiota bacterium]